MELVFVAFGMLIFALFIFYRSKDSAKHSEIHHMVRRIVAEPDEKGVGITGSMADTLVSGYLDAGWKLESIHVLDDVERGTEIEFDFLVPIQIVLGQLMEIICNLLDARVSETEDLLIAMKEMHQMIDMSLEEADKEFKEVQKSLEEKGYGVVVMWVLVR